MKKVKIKDIGEIITGKTPSSKNPEDFGYETMFITPRDIGSNKYVTKTERYLSKSGVIKLKSKLLPPNSIIVSCIGSDMGKVVMNNDYAITNQQLNSIIVNKGNYNCDYIYYVLKNSYKVLRQLASGSTALPLINKNDFSEIELNIADLKVQNNIAKILSNIDSKIENNNKILDELEILAKIIYDFWFLQFEFPNKEGKPYRSAGGQMKWNEELKREIPEGWVFEVLDKNVETIIDHRGKTPAKLGGDWIEKGIIALSAKVVKNGKLINLEEANQVSRNMYEKWMPVKLRDGDILMTSEAPLGEFYYLLGETEYCLSQRLYAIRANKNKIKPCYLYYELSKGNGLSQIMGSQSGSTVFGIRQDELRKIKILRPNIEIQSHFENTINPMLLKIKKTEIENRELVQLRDWLLPMLMNGQVGFKKR